MNLSSFLYCSSADGVAAEILSRDGHRAWPSVTMYSVPLNRINESRMLYPVNGIPGH